MQSDFWNEFLSFFCRLAALVLFILKSKQLPLSTKNGQQACYKFYNIMDV